MDNTAIKVPVTTGKVNPILKKEPHHQGAGGAASSPLSGATDGANKSGADGPTSPGGKENRHLTWDEHAIEEHDLLRGTRMKVR